MADIMDVKERIQLFISFKGLSIRSFEEKCSLSNGYIKAMRKGFGPDKLNNVLHEFPELNREWLLYGEGEMLKPTQPLITQNNVNGSNYNNCIDMGSSTMSMQEDIPYAEQVPVEPPTVVRQAGVDILEYVRDNFGVVEKSSVVVNDMQLTAWIPMPDDCMAPEIQKGDRLGLCAYKKGEENPIPGKIYAIDTMSNGTIVRYLYITAEGDFLMRSQNPTVYPDFIVKKSDVIAVYKKLIMVRI